MGEALAALVFLVFASSLRTAADPTLNEDTPAPRGIAFDEIARLLPPGAPPPSVGTFVVDAAAIAALPPLVVPKQHQLDVTALTALAVAGAVSAQAGPIGVLPTIIFEHAATAAGNAAVKANTAEFERQKTGYANGKLARQRTGILAKFAYYQGWSRVELAPGAVKIDKPDLGVTMTLDAASHTFTAVRTPPIGETFTATSAGVRGTAVLEEAPTVESLPEERIEGMSVRGYRTGGTITITRDSFLCAAGRHHVTETEYVADVPDPRYDATHGASGAQPLITACLLGNTVSHREPGKLVLYRTVIVDDDTPASFGIALERGNIRQLTTRDEAMFDLPDGYTEKH
ncbi:MAG: hypothetical protein M3O06_01445 [Pseudomonadota bacterium]|nr:hypothetical protein [Pseudomonadota bacterium]